MELVVKESFIGGKGVFAKTLIPKGERIVFLEGEKVSLSEVRQRIAEGTLSSDDPLQVGDEEFLLLEQELSYHFNHSCNPNAGVRGKNELFALRNIQKGEEIMFDYSTTEVPDTPWSMKCVCGDSSCRKLVAGLLSIPTEQLQKYKEHGAIPDYLKKNIEYA